MNRMLDNSFSYCNNEKCSKKEKCLRFAKKENIKNGQTYIVLTEKGCSKNNCYIDKKEYYRKMILDIINKVPNDDIDRKFLLDACYSLLEMSKEFNLENELKEKIKKLEKTN